MLFNDSKAKFRKEFLVLRVDREAKFYVERSGVFFQKVYRFQWKKGSQIIKYQGSWTSTQHLALSAKQREEPVPLTTHYKSGRTWWWFRNQFYWEDYSAKEVVEERRSGSEVLKEVQAFFLGGADAVYGISNTIYRFHCRLGHRRNKRGETLTEDQYQTLLMTQRENPVLLLSNAKSGRKWWMFRDKVYWEEADLNESEVKALLLDWNRSQGEEGRRRSNRKSLPNSVKLLVWDRDKGRCVQCGRDEDLEYDHIIPVSKGGSNTENNIQLLCVVCNRSKGANLV